MSAPASTAVARLLLVVAAATLAAAFPAAPPASASPDLIVGIADEAQTLYGNPDEAFALLGRLRTQALRVTLYWNRVAPSRPVKPANPEDLSYDWDTYDRAAFYAAQYGIRLVFTIYGTPEWAGGGELGNQPPEKMTDLRAFALAAGRRYSGLWAEFPGGRLIPKVDLWLAWNEPNNPLFLTPQWKPSGDRYVMASAPVYARMCTAIWSGVHEAGKEARVEETVGCGVTAPRGNNRGGGSRPSVSPLAFLQAMAKAGAKFDVYAHHPYAGNPFETPSTRPGSRTAVTLGNIDKLLSELTRLYGRKTKLWITEYGYQTNPPDRVFGVSWKKQAEFLREAFALARAHPRIDMMLWFLLRDEERLSGWQSGLMTAAGKKKPSFFAFRDLPRPG